MSNLKTEKIPLYVTSFEHDAIIAVLNPITMILCVN